jgi:hypothetical protein
MRTYFIILIAAVAGCGEVTTSKSGQPTVTAIAPALGPLPGGTTITITGTNFEGTPHVLIGDHLATDAMVMNGSTIIAKTPQGDAEGSVVDVTVSVDSGFATMPAAFTYNFLPVVLRVTPSLGKGTGGTNITVTGRGFDAGIPKITIGGGVATNVTVVDDTMLTATTAPIASGTKPFTPLDVALENDNGKATLRNAFQVTTKGLIVIERLGQLRIFHVDTTGTNTVSQIAAIPSGVSRAVKACALNPSNGQIYATQRNNNIHELITLNPLTGAITTVGVTQDAANAPHAIGTMTFIGNTLFGFDGGQRTATRTNRLVTININDGRLTPVGAAATAGILQHESIAIKDAATVFYADVLDGSLDTIATATSVLTTGQPLTGGAAGAGTPVKLASVGGTLFLMERADPGNIYTVNTATGALTRIATLPQGLFVAMCETPPNF